MLTVVRVVIVGGAAYLGLRLHSGTGTVTAVFLAGLALGAVSGARSGWTGKHTWVDRTVAGLAMAVGFEFAKSIRNHREKND